MSLPLASPSWRSTRARSSFRIGRHSEVIQRGLTIRIETALFNRTHDLLSDALADRYPTFRLFLVRFYDVGNLFSLLGLILGTCATFIAAVYLPVSALRGAGTAMPNHGPIAHTPPPIGQTIGMPSDERVLNPIIPGLTVPLNHLPVMFLALLGSQIIHEIGHAFAAAVEDIPLASAGISVTLVVPVAFVAIRSSEDASYSVSRSVSRLRVACAGAWHNLLLWILLSLAGRANLTSIWTMRGYGPYEDASSTGLVVNSIMKDSPLRKHIPLCSIIVRIDDTQLSAADDGYTLWYNYLVNRKTSVTEQGWCVSRSWYKGRLMLYYPQSRYFEPYCRNLLHATTVKSLFMTGPELASMGEVTLSSTRCDTICMNGGSKVEDTRENEICIRPRPDSTLLRIQLRLPNWPSQSRSPLKTVIWNGPREEVWEQVSVGKMRPRFWWIPVSVPLWSALLLRYTEMITLSLFLFNLLPIAVLDGGQILGLCLDILESKLNEGPSSSLIAEKMEMGEDASTSSLVLSTSSRRSRVERYVGFTTAMATAWVCMFSTAQEIFL